MATFVEVEAQYLDLRQQLEQGRLRRDQFIQQAGELMCRDEAGRWWTIHPETGIWHYRWGDEWRPGVPPGYTSGYVSAPAPVSGAVRPSDEAVAGQPSPTAAGRKDGIPSWMIVAAAALAVAVLGLVLTAVVVVPLLVGDKEPEAVTPETETAVVEATSTPQPSAAPSPEPSPAPSPTPASLPEATELPSTTPDLHGPDAAAYRPSWPEGMSDDFSQVDSGWSRGISEDTLIDYRDGVMRIELQGANRSAWSRYEDVVFADGWVEVSVVEIAGAGSATPGPSAGIAVHVVEDRGGYVFRIDGAGRYSVGRTLPGVEPALLDWTPSDHILTDGTPNQLGVLAQGNQYLFFINGWLVSEVEDQAYPAGILALWGATGADEAAQLGFDDVQLLVGSVAPPPTVTATETPTGEPTATLTPVPTAIPTSSPVPVAPTATPSPVRPTPSPTTPPAGYPPLSFEFSYGASYPGTGAEWIIHFHFRPQGGDGNYTYLVADQLFYSADFDFHYGCGTAFIGDVGVQSGDGQSSKETVYIAAVPCVP